VKTFFRSVQAWFSTSAISNSGKSEVQPFLPGIHVFSVNDKDMLMRFHRDVLAKCFHKRDLDSPRRLVANVKTGNYKVFLAIEGDEILGGIVVEHSWSMGMDAMLIAWVAVSENHRGRDVGTLLVKEAIYYAKSNGAEFLLGEVENPQEFEEEDPAYGNPDKRVKFYSRFDCQYLSVPYVVLMSNGQNEFGMMLTLFPLSEEQVTATEISSPTFALFMEEFVGRDETVASERLIEAAKKPVRMVPYKRLFRF
jgi:GNAT superfamily N-acetyltransferase